MDQNRPILFEYESVDSTLDEAQRLLKEFSPPFCILAKEQTAGRGRQGRTWHSPKGNIYFTGCYKAKVPLQELPIFTLYAALKVTRALNRHFGGQKLWLKWPNDIWHGKKKCAGFLAEAPAIKGVGRVLLLGVGLNCEKQKFPNELKKTATTLESVFGVVVKKERIGKILRDEIEGAYERFCDGRYIKEIYGLWLRYGKLQGKTIEFEEEGKKMKGKVFALAPDGALCVKSNGKVRALRSGEVTLSQFLRR